MLSDQSDSLFGRGLRQRHSNAQQESDVSHRERWQQFDGELLGQGKVTNDLLRPFRFRLDCELELLQEQLSIHPRPDQPVRISQVRVG